MNWFAILSAISLIGVARSKKCSDDATEAEDSFTLLRNNYKYFEVNTGEDVIIFFGDARSLKRDLIDGILGDDTRGTTQDKKRVFPKRSVAMASKDIYYDYPDFDDSRSLAADIASRYFLKRIMDSIHGIKIVLVLDYSSLLENGTNFVKLVDNVVSLMGNVDNYNLSICLIATLDYILPSRNVSITTETTTISATNEIRRRNNYPTNQSTNEPTDQQTDEPTNHPTNQTTVQTTDHLTDHPTNQPTDHPTNQPTDQLTDEPIDQKTDEPIDQQIDEPTNHPISQTTDQTTDHLIDHLTNQPTDQLTDEPTDQQTDEPTNQSTDRPTEQLTDEGTDQQTHEPTNHPINQTTDQTTTHLTDNPTNQTTDQLSDEPTNLPTNQTTDQLSDEPTNLPTNQTIVQTTDHLTDHPNNQPTDQLTDEPIDQQTDGPIYQPTTHSTEHSYTTTTEYDTSDEETDELEESNEESIESNTISEPVMEESTTEICCESDESNPQKEIEKPMAEKPKKGNVLQSNIITDYITDHNKLKDISKGNRKKLINILLKYFTVVQFAEPAKRRRDLAIASRIIKFDLVYSGLDPKYFDKVVLKDKTIVSNWSRKFDEEFTPYVTQSVDLFLGYYQERVSEFEYVLNLKRYFEDEVNSTKSLVEDLKKAPVEIFAEKFLTHVQKFTLQYDEIFQKIRREGDYASFLREIPFKRKEWVRPLNRLLDRLEEMKNWYSFLAKLYEMLSDYKFAKKVSQEALKITSDSVINWLASSKLFDKELLNKVEKIEKNRTMDDYLLKVLKPVFEKETIMTCKDNKLLVRGRYVFLSFLKKCSVTQIVIYCTNTFFIDTDYSPAGSLKIVARKWVVVGDRKIQMAKGIFLGLILEESSTSGLTVDITCKETKKFREEWSSDKGTYHLPLKCSDGATKTDTKVHFTQFQIEQKCYVTKFIATFNGNVHHGQSKESAKSISMDCQDVWSTIKGYRFFLLQFVYNQIDGSKILAAYMRLSDLPRVFDRLNETEAVEELFELQKRLGSKLYNTHRFINLYQLFLQRVADKKTSIVAAIRAHLIRMKSQSRIFVQVDITKFLDFVKTTIKEIQYGVSMDNQLTNYKNIIDNKTREVYRILDLSTIPKAHKIEEEVNEIVDKVLDVAKGNDRKLLKRYVMYCAIFESMSMLSIVLKFFVIAGEVIGGVIEKLPKWGKEVNDEMVEMVDDFEKYVKKYLKIRGDASVEWFKVAKNIIDSSSYDLKEEVKKLEGDSSVVFDDVGNLTRFENGLDSLTRAIKREAKKRGGNFEKGLDESRNTANLASGSMYLFLKNQEKKSFYQAIEEESYNLEKIKEIMNLIYGSVRSIMKDMFQQLKQQSLESLDKFGKNIKDNLWRINFLLSKSLSGFSNHDELVGFFWEMKDVMNTIVNVFDYLQAYNDKKLLSLQLETIRVSKNVSASQEKLTFLIKTNLILEQYQIAINAFKQHAFPFVEKYMFQFETPKKLLSNDLSKVTSKTVNEIDKIPRKLTTHTRIESSELNLHSGKFYSDPFYTWDSKRYSGKITKLLRGEEITLIADIRRVHGKSSIKFNKITLNISLVSSFPPSKDVQKALINIKKFLVKMKHSGNSYFRCGEMYYVISTDSRSIEVSFGIEEQAESMREQIIFRRAFPVLSPYAVWTLQLNDEKRLGFGVLEPLVNAVDLHLVGEGHYTEQDAKICQTNITYYYIIEDLYN